jgi:hypothetical protein
LGANNGALHTTWRNSGAGVSGAAVDIGDPGSEGETADAEKAESMEAKNPNRYRRHSRSNAGIGREMGSAGSVERAGGARVRMGRALVREEREWIGLDEGGLAAVCSRR